MAKALQEIAKLLLVDDSIEDIAFTKAILERSKVNVDISYVRDGSEAVAFLEKVAPYADASRPDVIFLDISMPQMSGLELLAFIKGKPKLCDIPVVMCSGSDAPEDVKQSIELGAFDYIVKPILYETFKRVIEKIETMVIVENEDGYVVQRIKQ